MKGLQIAVIVAAAFLLTGAIEDPGGRFTATLTGADVRPPVDTETDGRFSIRFNEEETEGRVYLRVDDGVGITEAHLHCRQLTFVSGQNPIAVTLLGLIPGGKDINRALKPIILDDEQIAAQNPPCGINNLRELREAILRGRIYADVHSVAHPGGEIQGQVSFYRQDTDEDGLIDRHDPDIDGDGILNEDDNTPYTRNLKGGGVPDEHVVAFHFDLNDGGGALYCNNPEKDKPVSEEPAPFTGIFKCSFNGNGEITIERANWGGTAVLPQNDNITGNTVVLREDNTITGSCDGSVIPTENVMDDYVLKVDCERAHPPDRVPATGGEIVNEWFTDIPWHQKLSTKDSNLIDVPFVLPFESLKFPPNAPCPSDAPAIIQSRCMLQYGIVNVMGMHRTDNLYKPEEAAHATDQDCQNEPCVEVKLKVQRFHTLTDHPDGYEADKITNNEYSYLDPDRPPDKPDQMVRVPSQGYAITEATIFAPWLPWYTGHYCAVDADNKADSVCYEDYFTTQLIAPADPNINEFWLRDNPALFVPNPLKENVINNGPQAPYSKFCRKGEKSCDLYLGKVDWLKDVTKPLVTDCRIPKSDNSVPTCQAEVDGRTDDVVRQFNNSIEQFPDQGRYPWTDDELPKSKTELSANIQSNPFIGSYQLKRYSFDNLSGRMLFKGTHYVLPNLCYKEHFRRARQGLGVNPLKKCALNFEIHTSGFHEIWENLYGGSLKGPNIEEINRALPGFAANQYGRTLFLFAGVPEQKLPVSYRALDDGMSIYDKMYGSSLYTQYLPLVNPADLTLNTKNYTDAYWHNILMSNHMNQDPKHFIRGIRGRTLWHNEYRSQVMYHSAEADLNKPLVGTPFEKILGYRDFPAGFQPESHTSPFHGNTCDSCHVRNGSGIPLMPNGKLPNIHVGRGMRSDNYQIHLDYTYSNKNIPSMKMVLFDLQDAGEPFENCDVNDHAVPREFYKNAIMNFYGNSFHVNQENGFPTYTMAYEDVTDNSGGFEIVVVDENQQPIKRKPKDSQTVYTPQRITIDNIVSTNNKCVELADKPDNADDDVDWPAKCDDVNGDRISTAISTGQIGFLHLNGRRLGNTPLIEMIPTKTITDTQQAQSTQAQPADTDPDKTDPIKVGLTYPGCYGLAPGTRGGGATHYRSCDSSNSNDCYISRFGWIGDRASLEDQIANAAHVEMNLTSKDSYKVIQKDKKGLHQLVRYNRTLCGPADASCQKRDPNSDITEQEIKDMAVYQRWIGIPNRAEYQVSSKIVQEGEKVFKMLKCHSCHVIDKITYVENDNMLPDEERKSLSNLQKDHPDYPFISYLGTDLLLHDMGYLSQVANAPTGKKIRNSNGTVIDDFKAYVQPIRTPALKGLRFNRFVTDSNHNTQKAATEEGGDITGKKNFEPGCDFLLHDGRACDAIEAAFLHDGPAIKALKMIEALNKLESKQLKQLRAFLYSL